jgi:hypothetical protein
MDVCRLSPERQVLQLRQNVVALAHVIYLKKLTAGRAGKRVKA